MKKLSTLILAAGLATSAVYADQPMTLTWGGLESPPMYYDGDLISAYDGYVATMWWGTSESSLTLLTSTCIADYYDADYIGLWGDAQAQIRSDPGTPIYSEVRIFQYTPGQLIDDTTAWAYNPATLTVFWDSLQSGSGLEVPRATIGGWSTLDSMGADTWVYLDYDRVTPLVLTTGSAVPEPSTYAALAGLAIMAWAALRRSRR
ncbi:PEP-CTERM putative exosortase interaction domain-containing protein [Opitutaceae bacterium TAV1]|nr:PEP-CTERM putative exosortase interaction domain-containing protein [Opitutaceae bacterium TAV1]